MKTFWQKYLLHSGLIAAQVVIGVLLLIDPEGFTRGIVTVLGVCMLLTGLWSVWRYFRTAPQEAAKEQRLSRGLGLALFGAFCTFNAGWFVNSFAALHLLYAMLLTVCALYKVQRAADAQRLHMGGLLARWLSAGATLLFALVILLDPFSASHALWIFTGIALIVLAGLDAAVFVIRRTTCAAA